MSDKVSNKLVGVLAVLGAGGCAEEDPCEELRTFDAPPEPTATATAPPIVLSGEWVSANVLELQFSKPLAVGSAPEPSRFALINWNASAAVYDPYYGSGTAVCNLRSSYRGFGLTGGYYYQSGASVIDAWIAPEDPTLLRVRTASANPTCRTNTDIVADGLMLVYVDGDGAGERLLEDNGDAVRDLGPSWAIQPWEDCVIQAYEDNYGYFYCGFALSNYATGHLPSISTLAPIPCPS